MSSGAASTVASTNVRNTGSLVVTKTTTGDWGTFTFDVDCTGDTTTQCSRSDSGSRTISGIPTGVICIVAEGADAVFTSRSKPVNGQVSIGTGTNTVASTNVRKTGDLVLTKATTGGSGTFTFDVNCDGTAFDQVVTITGNGSKISGIPTGTTCTAPSAMTACSADLGPGRRECHHRRRRQTWWRSPMSVTPATDLQVHHRGPAAAPALGRPSAFYSFLRIDDHSVVRPR